MNTRAAALRVALAAALAVTGGMAQAEINRPVKTAQGQIKGASAGKGVSVFKNIPFAAAPIGALRFQPAQAPAPWEGVRDGTKWGDTCVQPPAPTRSRLARGGAQQRCDPRLVEQPLRVDRRPRRHVAERSAHPVERQTLPA